MSTKHWCINDIWEIIEETYCADIPWLSDCGVGLAWSREWKERIASRFTQERFQGTCPEVGLDVWYYPEECKGEFFFWLDGYVRQRVQEMANHKSQAPVLPIAGYKAGTRFSGKTAYFTGFYKNDKKSITDIIAPQTGIILEESFKKTTSFLIMGPNRGLSKIEKAMSYGIPCISAEIFVEEVTEYTLG